MYCLYSFRPMELLCKWQFDQYLSDLSEFLLYLQHQIPEHHLLNHRLQLEQTMNMLYLLVQFHWLYLQGILYNLHRCMLYL